MSTVNSAPTNAVDLLGKLKTVDSTNSGLDADLVRGKKICYVVYGIVSEVLTIYDSYGVSGVTDIQNGFFDLLFSSDFANINYCLFGFAQQYSSRNASDLSAAFDKGFVPAVDHCRIATFTAGADAYDPQRITVVIMGD